MAEAVPLASDLTARTSSIVTFGAFLIDRAAGGLFRFDEHLDRIPVALGSRAFEVLCVLVERRGDLVSKQAIMDAVWKDVAVEENLVLVFHRLKKEHRFIDGKRSESWEKMPMATWP